MSRGWRRTFLWLKFKSRGPKKNPPSVLQSYWNPAIDLHHKVFWMAYGPDFQWWFQFQGHGQIACGFTWLSFGLQFMRR